jgi:hypothetical protein
VVVDGPIEAAPSRLIDHTCCIASREESQPGGEQPSTYALEANEAWVVADAMRCSAP